MKIIESFWTKWKSITQKVGDFQIKVVFSFLYLVLIFPLGFLTSLLADFLERKSLPIWHKLEGSFENLEELKEQS